MVSLTEVRASNAQLTIASTPRVAVFVGATAGIGKAALQQLVSCGFPIKAYIVGREEAAFLPFLSELRNLNQAAEFVFLQGQISLMAETKRLTEVILNREHKIDLLYLSSGFLPFLGRQETTEGLELAMAVAYYSRQIFIRRLLPLLRAATNPGADSYLPRIINVLGTGVETADLFLDDLTLKEPGHFSIQSYVSHAATMTSSSLKRIAEKPENQGVAIIHHHPGLVSTNLLKKSWGDKWNERPQGGSFNQPTFVQSTPLEAGERSLYLITSAKYGGNGVPIKEGQKEGQTVNGTTNGSLLCVNDELETLPLGNLLNSLEKSGAVDVIWNKTNELVGKYL